MCYESIDKQKYFKLGIIAVEHGEFAYFTRKI